MIKKLLKLCLSSTLLFTGITQLTAETIYVKPSAESTAWSDQTTVYTDLNDAITAAAVGDEIWVAAGVYYPTTGVDQSVSFTLKEGVNLYGGFAGTETSVDDRNWNLNKTVLNGDIGDKDDSTDNVYHLVYCNVGTTYSIILDGFTIKNGGNGKYQGGGIYLRYGNLILKNLIIQNNQGTNGGGLTNYYGYLRCENCVISQNTGNYGGGFYNNYGESHILNCTIVDNKAIYTGGGIFRNSNSYNVSIVNSIVYNNTASYTSNLYNLDNTTIYSCIEGGFTGEGNISDDPGFISSDLSDYRLATGSSCLNVGINDSVFADVEYDINHKARIQETTVDMGASEGNYEIPDLISPLQDSIISSTGSVNTVSFEWGWDSSFDQSSISSYLLQYWQEGEGIISVSIANYYTQYETSLASGQQYSWRIVAITESGDYLYSSIQSFAITHYGPFYVKEGSTGDGSGWDNAFGDLQDALADAIIGDEIWVAAGTYYPTDGTNQSSVFSLNKAISIFGGFAGTETSVDERNWNINKTILSGDIGESGVDTDNSYHILYGNLDDSQTVVIDGFVIENGGVSSYNGGGLYINTGSFVIKNSLFQNNNGDYGGAIYNYNGFLTCINCIMPNNAASFGGAVCNYTGVSKIKNSTIVNNQARSQGGAIFSWSSKNSFRIDNSIVYYNTAEKGYSNIPNGNYDSIVYSCIEGGNAVEGNITDAPGIIDITSGNFQLRMNSPCLNTGINDSLPADIICDWICNTRIQSTTIDMGAIEGGIVTPILLCDLQDSIIAAKESVVNVGIQWGWDSDYVQPSYSSYILQYWTDGGDTVSIALDSNISTYELKLADGLNYSVRVDAVTESGYNLYSEEQTFSINHSHPLYVKEGFAGDGTSWESAFGEIQDALDEAITGDEIWVAAGTYYPTDDNDQSAYFTLNKEISLYGGFAGTETSVSERDWNTNKSVLSGNIGDSSVNTDNSRHILYCNMDNSITVVIDGFEIDNGGVSSYSGGGLYLISGSVIIKNSMFLNNNGSDGAAIYNYEGSLCCINCIISNNTAIYGGAIYSVLGSMQIKSCTIVNNVATSTGGGIYKWSNVSYLTIDNSIIYHNTALSSSNLYNQNNTVATYSCIDGVVSGDSNISDDPGVIDAGSGNFNLRMNSPCLNSGINDSIPSDIVYDINGNTRIQDTTIDMGAVEGGMVTPVLFCALQDSIIDVTESILNIEIKWGWDSNYDQPSFSSYILQYWTEGGDTVSIALDTNTTTYELNLAEGQTYSVRVDAVTESLYNLYTEIQTFTTTHSHPLYVKEGLTGDGSNWDNAFGDLQDALSEAVSGDEIWVAAGTYFPTDGTSQSAYFTLDKSISLYGGFAGTENSVEERNWYSNKSVLSGNIGEASDDSDNSYHVLYCSSDDDESIVMDGFVIEEGGADSYQNGGGLYLNTGNITIKNTIFQNNNGSDGGAIYNYNGILKCVNSVFTKNTADYGSAIYTYSNILQLINCTIIYNNCKYAKGTVYVYDADSYIVNSIIYNNTFENPHTTTSGYPHNISYSCVEWNATGNGNISLAPELLDPENGDFRLRMNSPCLNAGINDSIPKDVFYDLIGKDRIQGDTIDMGACEGAYVSPILITPVKDSILESRGSYTNVELKWGWDTAYVQPDFTSYILQYWHDGTDSTTLLIDSSITFDDLLFADGTDYEWRVAAVSENDGKVFSKISSFAIPHAHPIYVKEGSSGDGSSWDSAYGNLQDAIAYAVDGDQIWIAEGIYYPTDDLDQSTYFEITKQLKIYGGFVGTESSVEDRDWNTNQTILSGDIGVVNDSTDNSYHVVFCELEDGQSAEINGIIVENGGSITNYDGGSFYIETGSVVLKNSKLRNNISFYGGAIYNREGELSCMNVILTNNTAYYGGAIYNYYGTNNLINCTIVNNAARYHGGGVYMDSSSSTVSMVNCIVYGNTTEYIDSNVNSLSKATYSCIEGGYSGKGNISDDPQFVDVANGNYHLLATSPCINAGINDSIPEDLEVDVDGITRIIKYTVDMGAYEAAYLIPVSPTITNPNTNITGTGISYAWSSETNGNSGMTYSSDLSIQFKLWKMDDADNVLEDVNVNTLGYYSVLDLERQSAYKWLVGVVTNDYTYWSDTATFYLGADHPLYVKEGATGDGTSWSSAYGTITEALTDASAGDEIWVAAGTYYPSDSDDKDASFSIASYVGLYGGFTGSESSRSLRQPTLHPTILSGDIGTIDDISDNSSHILRLDGTSESSVAGVIIEGFTIRNGNATSSDGGAIYANYADYKLTNCIFDDNTAVNGGAIANYSSSSYLYNNLLYNNTASNFGGAVYNDSESSMDMLSCTVTKNSSGINGDGTIVNTIVYGNNADQIVGSPTITYSCIQGGYAGTGNTAYDPVFKDAANNNFELGEFSSCFNQGSSDALPSDALLDLSCEDYRTWYGKVDIGAFEIHDEGIGTLTLNESSPANNATGVSYDSEVVLTFNQPVEVLNADEIILSPENVVFTYSFNEDSTICTLKFDQNLTFDETYTFSIPSGAIIFRNNDQIVYAGSDIQFSVRSCEAGQVSIKNLNETMCPLTQVVLKAQTSGDVNADYVWSYDSSYFDDYAYVDSMVIASFGDNLAGVYTCNLTDMCGNDISGNIDLQVSSSVTKPEIVTKWDDVLVVDNSDTLFSDYQWYKGSYLVASDIQYITIDTDVEGSYSVSVYDNGSGCISYSDTLSYSPSVGLNYVSMYPNPVNPSNPVTVDLGTESTGKIYLYDMKGVLLFKDEFSNLSTYSLKETDFPTGVYLVKVIAKGKETISKLSIK